MRLVPHLKLMDVTILLLLLGLLAPITAILQITLSGLGQQIQLMSQG